MWIVATLAGLAGLIILLLCIPLDMTLHVDAYGKPKFSFKLTWLFGLISKDIKKREKKPEEKEKEVGGKPKRRRRKIGAKTIFDILRTRGLLVQFKRLLTSIIVCFKIRELITDLRVGLDNPADTGILFAIIGPPIFFLNSYLTHIIRVQPAFDRAVFEGYSYGVVRLQPIQLVPPLLRFAFSLAILRVARTVILSKWKRKK